MADSKDLGKDPLLDDKASVEELDETLTTASVEDDTKEDSSDPKETSAAHTSPSTSSDESEKAKNRHKMKKSGNPAKGTKRSIEAARAAKQRPAKPAKVKSLQSPRWWAPLLVALMLIGLVIVVSAYVMGGNFPIKGFGNGNLFIGFGFMLVGFLMTLGWK